MKRIPMVVSVLWGGIVGGLIPVVTAGEPASPPAPSPAAKGPWEFTAALAVKETFDGNVYLQDVTSLARQESMVTAITPSLGVTYQRTPAFKAAFSYAPDVVFYHAESSEDHVAHRGSFNFTGKVRDTAWEMQNGVVWIDGDDQGPIFLAGGDIPVIGGVPLRDRRDAAIYRNSARVTRTIGPWFVRPLVTSYVHDFQTEQHARTGAYAGYENYVDRYEVGGGVDGGYKVFKNASLVMGYRYGHQGQRTLLGASSPYSNNYHRILAGVEGMLTDWLKVNVLAGPDLRDFPNASPGFHGHEMLYFVDASVTITPTKQDTVALAIRRYEQPAFASHSVYEDITYDMAYRRKFGGKITAGAGVKVYAGDWQSPVNREDWIYTPSAALNYTFNKNLGAELAWSRDSAESRVPGTEGREFTRNLVSLGFKYTR
ncbi:MAG: hypothetical protein V1809_01385 [Planctomycetota bacterium]